MADDYLIPTQFPISDMGDVVKARRHGREMALALGFPLAEATKIAVVISELGRNIILYAGDGTVLLTPFTGRDIGLRVVAQDQGPGIENLELALRGGYTTSKGLGIGLSGSKRMMDAFDVQTGPGRGTHITATKWLR